MSLTDTFIKQVKHSGKPAGDKHSDGQALYLHVTAAGKYWRMSYGLHGKQRLLALGVYPAVSLAAARRLRDSARAQLARGIDPIQAKRDVRAARAAAAENTSETVARTWLAKTAANRAASTQEKNATWLEKNISPRSDACRYRKSARVTYWPHYKRLRHAARWSRPTRSSRFAARSSALPSLAASQSAT